MLRCAITDRSLCSGDGSQRQAALIREAARWAIDGIDLIQLREKDLPAAEIAGLAREILKAITSAGSATKLLINSRPDIAVATGAHGVHLTSSDEELTPAHVRSLYSSASLPPPVITVSCHTLDDVLRARDNHPDAILFAPVFEKVIAGLETISGKGLEQLRNTCTAASPVPVYALGGVTQENAPACLQAGAAGIAGIRLFHAG
jgi:thiamine-phosphate pyrophosphorylase